VRSNAKASCTVPKVANEDSENETIEPMGGCPEA
jgi:hypothetical protein